MKTYKRHKYDETDKCVRCGIIRKVISVVGSGFGVSWVSFRSEYSKDNGIHFQTEKIQCVVIFK